MTSAGSAAFPIINNAPGSSTKDGAARRISSYDTDTDFAYEANPTSDYAFCSPVYAPSNANDTYNTSANAGTSHSLASRSTNATTAPQLNLASFGSLPLPSTSAPYLDFAPQPVYEPTGELVHEVVGELEQFNIPSSFRKTRWTAEPEAIAFGTRQTLDASAIAVPSVSFTRDQQNFPKPALKRSVEPDSDNVRQPGDQNQRPESRKLRKVSFEAMSGTGLTSADDEDSSGSEGPSNVRPGPPGRLVDNSRRGRGSRTTNESSSRSTASRSAGTRPPVTSGKGSKTPTGHPPSILPPEKVFPIQIGSDLFRLSGASISSDAPSYFTQFFEEQVRQNEESGGVRTLYIDRDPETFRDVARHLQGYYVKPRDGSHFVKLFADAQFYSCKSTIESHTCHRSC